MEMLLSFSFGLLAAFLGVIPPGLINLTAVKISTLQSKNAAYNFSFGAVFIVFFQTYFALISAQYIALHEEVIHIIRIIGCILFGLLTIYFIIIAEPAKKKDRKGNKIKRLQNNFTLGMLISLLNFFPIPYYAYFSISLASLHYFYFNNLSILLFTIGTVVGSFVIFFLYISYFKRIETKTNYFRNKTNQIIGTVTGIVAIISLIQIIKHYF